MIPTYNERENIANLIDKILKLKIKNLHIVVSDDNSPDGTWKIVQKIAKKNKNVHLLLRKKDKGRGSGGRDGFIFCLRHGADIIVEMDYPPFEANARLIAAAPELLMALTELFAMVQGEVPRLLEDHHLWDEISAVIAKAKGTK